MIMTDGLLTGEQLGNSLKSHANWSLVFNHWLLACVQREKEKRCIALYQNSKNDWYFKNLSTEELTREFP